MTLAIKQAYPLKMKIRLTERRIKDFYNYFGGQVYISFSGGKDSTVLLDIARNLYPEIEAVFCDTGLEFPEIRDFVKTIDNVTWIKPKLPFTKVIEKYGWPIVSKEQSQYIYQYRTAKSQKTKDTRLNGNKWGQGKISLKWRYLLDAPFKISDKCCDILKKNPAKKFEKQSGKKPIIGTMASESAHRQSLYIKHGCNSFNSKRPTSKPLSFWLDKDIWEYITLKKIDYSKIYNMGYTRTGCMFCLFGHHMALKNNHDKLKLMKETHNNQYEYCMKNLGMKEVLDWYPEKKDNGE